ncbi:hypothetical protein K438DRAFT_528186 [Mycena galopus ATCC 62051]|nr:hypothetical protein K438DRAFT_528186 [Mycena galopus ATCC 62051]
MVMKWCLPGRYASGLVLHCRCRNRYPTRRWLCYWRRRVAKRLWDQAVLGRIDDSEDPACSPRRHPLSPQHTVLSGARCRVPRLENRRSA